MKRIFSHSEAVSQELAALLREKRGASGPAAPWKTDLLERLLPFAASGKLLRSSVACFSYEAFAGQAPPADVIKAAAALELAHSSLLIHDDIMDGDDTRRGRPSLHRQYYLYAKENGLARPEDFGTGMAMCVADAGFFLAFELLAGTPPAARRLFTEWFALTCAGQMQDLHLEAGAGLPAKKDIYRLMETKTAGYTLALPLAIGATMAGGNAAVLRALQSIGVAAGIIFQIRDDELGVFGDTRATGKPVGNDVREGKKTLFYYFLMKKAGAGERKKLRAIFGNRHASTGDIAYVRRCLQAHGIPLLLNREIERLQVRASRGIAGLEMPETARKELEELVDFCATRQL